MTWRNTIRNNTETQLTDYEAANPTLLKGVKRARPGSFPETPFAYIGDIRLTFQHTAGSVRTVTDGEVDIHLILDTVDSVESKDELDDLVDGLTDYLSNDAQKHYLGSNIAFDTLSSSDTSESVGSVVYTGVILTIGGITGQQGF
jgi:hypothetical protein